MCVLPNVDEPIYTHAQVLQVYIRCITPRVCCVCACLVSICCSVLTFLSSMVSRHISRFQSVLTLETPFILVPQSRRIYPFTAISILLRSHKSPSSRFPPLYFFYTFYFFSPVLYHLAPSLLYAFYFLLFFNYTTLSYYRLDTSLDILPFLFLLQHSPDCLLAHSWNYLNYLDLFGLPCPQIAPRRKKQMTKTPERRNRRKAK